MSVILEALQKARREHAERSVAESHQPPEGGAEEGYQIVYRPATRAPKPARGARWWLVVFIGFSSLMLLVLVAAVLYLVLLKTGHLQPNPLDWLQARPAATAVAVPTPTPALAPSPVSSMPTAELPVVNPTPPPVPTRPQAMPQQIAGSVVQPVAVAPQAGQALSVSTPAGDYAAGAPPSLSNQLPTPVPLQELESSLAASGTGENAGSTPSAKTPATVDGLTLGTILYDAVSPMATINGRLVHQGKTYGDLTIVRITQNDVLIRRKDGSQFTLSHGL